MLGAAQRATASGARIFQILDRAPAMVAPDRARRRCPPAPARVSLRRRRPHASRARRTTRAARRRPRDRRPGARSPSSARWARARPRSCSLLPRLYDVSAGSVRIDGADVREVDLVSLRRAIAVVDRRPVPVLGHRPRQHRLRPPGRHPRGGRAAAARAAQADGFIERLPDGYDTLVGERGLTLSGGQRQRIAIARAILADPRILILDDATSSVDASTEQRDQARAARGDGGPHDVRDRPPALDDRARRRDRRARARPGRRPRHARRAARALRRSTARSSRRACPTRCSSPASRSRPRWRACERRVREPVVLSCGAGGARAGAAGASCADSSSCSRRTAGGWWRCSSRCSPPPRRRSRRRRWPSSRSTTASATTTPGRSTCRRRLPALGGPLRGGHLRPDLPRRLGRPARAPGPARAAVRATCSRCRSASTRATGPG